MGIANSLNAAEIALTQPTTPGDRRPSSVRCGQLAANRCIEAWNTGPPNVIETDRRVLACIQPCCESDPMGKDLM
jgi:hypothetical protein